jgi:hypothetical protein
MFTCEFFIAQETIAGHLNINTNQYQATTYNGSSTSQRKEGQEEKAQYETRY